MYNDIIARETDIKKKSALIDMYYNYQQKLNDIEYMSPHDVDEYWLQEIDRGQNG